MKNNKQNSPNQIAQVRTIRGLNRKKISGLLGHKTVTTIGYWETGFKVPNLKNAIKLQILLDARIDQLFPCLTQDASEELTRAGWATKAKQNLPVSPSAG